MRVLIAHPDLQAGGGAEVYARALVSVLRQRGHAVGLCDIPDICLPRVAIILRSGFALVNTQACAG